MTLARLEACDAKTTNWSTEHWKMSGGQMTHPLPCSQRWRQEHFVPRAKANLPTDLSILSIMKGFGYRVMFFWWTSSQHSLGPLDSLEGQGDGQWKQRALSVTTAVLWSIPLLMETASLRTSPPQATGFSLRWVGTQWELYSVAALLSELQDIWTCIIVDFFNSAQGNFFSTLMGFLVKEWCHIRHTGVPDTNSVSAKAHLSLLTRKGSKIHIINITVTIILKCQIKSVTYCRVFIIK